MKVLFLSNQNSCRSQMAEAILRSFNNSLEIYSAGIEPVDHISLVAIDVLAEIGIGLKPSKPHHYSKYEDLEFDYLITVGDGTNEELTIPSIKYKYKLHIGFKNPYKGFKNSDELHYKCKRTMQEIFSELDYFYNRILKEKISGDLTATNPL